MGTTPITIRGPANHLLSLLLFRLWQPTTALTTTISVRDRFLFGSRLLDEYGRRRSVLHKAVECNRRSLLTSTLATTTRLKASSLPLRVLYRSTFLS